MLDLSIMEFFTPVSWIFLDLVVIALLFYLMSYVIKNEKHSVFIIISIFTFITYTGISENLGGILRMHPYSPYRLLRIGKVALTIPILEAILFFSAFLLVKNLIFPKWLSWTKPFIIGFVGSFPDYIIDIVMNADTYVFDGLAHAQWNWHWPTNLQQVYENSFYGVPYFNYSGWYFFITYFAISFMVGAAIYKKTNYNSKVAHLLPIVFPFTSLYMMQLPTGAFALFGNVSTNYSMSNEFRMLAIWTVLAIIILVIGRKVKDNFDYRKHLPIFIIPLVIELSYIFVAVFRGFYYLLPACLIVLVIHGAFLGNIVRQSKKNQIDISDNVEKSLFININ